MKRKVVCYSLAGLTSTERSNFQRALYGFKDISNNGKYTYRRNGVMSEVKYKKVYFSAVVVNTKKLAEVVKLMKKFGAEVHVTDFQQKEH